MVSISNMSDQHCSKERAAELADKMLPFVFDLPSASLIFVDNEKLIVSFKTFAKDAILIGIDTETKPTFIPKRFIIGKPNPTALIQIAIRTAIGSEKVFVVDLLKICANSQLAFALDAALQHVMHSTTCIKLGQGLTNDIRELAEAYPTMKAFRLVNSVLETHDLIKYLQPVLRNPMSLKNLTKEYLNCDLLKTQQMSDWSRRPLSSQQMHYAACDALVLLRLHDAISCEIEEKLCPSTDSDEGSDSGTYTTSSESQASEDRLSLVKNTIATLCRTVDFTRTDFTNVQPKKSKPGKLNKIQKHKRSIDIKDTDPADGSSFLRNWQSQPAKEWMKTQLNMQGSGSTDKKRPLEEDGCSVKKARCVSYVSENEGDDAFHLPLPAGAGKHVVYK